MKKVIGLFVGIILLHFLASGCAYNVAFKTPEPYQYETTIPLRVVFYMDKTLKDEKSSQRGIPGWVVPIGDIVHMYAISYMKNGFESFQEIETLNEKPTYDVLVKVNSINYYFHSLAERARCDLTFNIENSLGNLVFDKTYHADGPSGFGRVAVGGVFAEKSARRQSTHAVMVTIFNNFMDDVRTNFNNWER